MSDSSYQRLHGPQLREPPARRPTDWPTGPSLGDVLQRMVRRIVRTQIARTDFQARVLDEARRLLDNHGNAMEREAFERLIVDRLLCACCDSRFNPAAQGSSPACPSTWGRILEVTFRGPPRRQ